VTVALTVSRHFPLREASTYIAAQATGAVGAGLVLLAAWPDKTAHLAPRWPTVGVGTAFLYEALMTAFLVFVVFAVATDTRAVGVVAVVTRPRP
jgi:aquaporin NIP